MPSSIFARAQRVGDYTKRLLDLSDEIAGVQRDIGDYVTRIQGGSHVGLGHYIQQGDDIINILNRHHDRTSQQQTMHSHLNLGDLKTMYRHAVISRNQAGRPHPPNHPIDCEYTGNTLLAQN